MINHRTLGYASLGFVLTACGIDTSTFAPTKSPDQLVTVVQLEHHAYNLATASPYNTVQLHTTVLSGTGQVVNDTVVYSVANPQVLAVSSDGVLTALAATARTIVRASVTRNGATRRDSAIVNIIEGVPAAIPARVAFQLAEGDSAKASSSRFKTVQLIRDDSLGENMPNLTVSLTSMDTTIATVQQSNDEVEVGTRLPGRAMLYVSAYAYGVSLRDSLLFVVGWPAKQEVMMYSRYKTGSTEKILDYTPGQFTVGVGACVTWYNQEVTDSAYVDVEFDDPSAASPPTVEACGDFLILDTTGGNIPPFRLEWLGDDTDFRTIYRGRVFNRPGVYPFHSNLYGTSGTITVCDEAHDSSCAVGHTP